MRILCVITGIIFVFFLTPLTAITGYLYTMGGGFEAMLEMMFSDIDKMFEIGIIQRIALSKYGWFGLYLQVLTWLQFAAGIIIIFKGKACKPLFSFLCAVVLLSLGAELVGWAYTKNFGILNGFGSVAAVTLGIIAVWMYRRGIKQLDLERLLGA